MKRFIKKTITITWKAFGEPASATITINTTKNAEEICEAVFRDTNLYGGDIWDALVPVLPEDRTHTALSVGDEVEIDGVVYRCDVFGWAYTPAKELEHNA
jgi:hypothetical protein